MDKPQIYDRVALEEPACDDDVVTTGVILNVEEMPPCEVLTASGLVMEPGFSKYTIRFDDGGTGYYAHDQFESGEIRVVKDAR